MDHDSTVKGISKGKERLYEVMAGFILVVLFLNVLGLLAVIFSGKFMEHLDFIFFGFINLVAWYFAVEIQ